MRILHLPSSFFPASTGGKEVFVYQLIKNSSADAEHLVVIHTGTEKRQYQYNHINVQVLPATITVNEGYSYYTSIYKDLQGFEEVLLEFKPDIVHFHDQGEGASLSHLRACKKLGFKTLLTYHSPGQSCLQRSLLREEKIRCDGKILVDRCSACRYAVAGLPTFAANIASYLPVPFDTNGKFVKRNSTALFIKSWKEFYDTIDGIQVHAGWVKTMLLLNNVAEEKLHFIEMGGHTSAVEYDQNHHNNNHTLKLVFIGRCTDIKGVHLLIDAVQMLPKETAIEVHFFGPYWDNTNYGKEMLEKVKGDGRFMPPRLIAQDDVIGELTKMDVCVIPSIWPETGPFTVFDAFAADLPIIGSNYAGIAERVKDGVDGLLFEWGNSENLFEKIQLIIGDKRLVLQLKENIKRNHSFSQMAADFSLLYKKISL